MIAELHHGDCLEVLRTLSDASCDSLVTDPPAGISFMGKDWDKDKGGRDAWVSWMRDVMAECLRVLKPGAHALVWAIPRTSHWTATALEDAGFEIRDVVTHLFGTGFPKSLDISKAIDKAAGAERPVIGKKAVSCGTGEAFGKGVGDRGGGTVIDVTAPATPEAQRWQGWGTALKPASEHWILARKPLSEKNVAANVLKWGTGGINVDASRIGTETITTQGYRNGENGSWSKQGMYADNAQYTPKSHVGRFPANLVLSHADGCSDDECAEGCAVRMLDEQSGILKSGKPGIRRKPHSGDHIGQLKNQPIGETQTGFGDSGGASRFFYCAKASRKDRNSGAKRDREQASNREATCTDGLFDSAGNPARRCSP